MTAPAPTFAAVAAMHPRLAGVADFYHAKLEPWLAAKEIERQQALKRLYVVTAIAVGAAVVAVLTSWAYGLFEIEGGFFMAAFGIGIPMLIIIGIGGLGVSRVQASVKRELATELCEWLGFTYREEPLDPSLGWFRELQLVPGSDRESFEDEIAGEHDGVTFTLFEGHLEDRRTERTKNGTRTYYVTVFRGLMAEFTFPKRFEGRTAVLKGGFMDGLFGGFGKPGERVKLEDPRFEKLFDVYASDQVEARYLLTPTFMERACELADAIGGRLQLAFDRERLLITVNGGADRFEGGSMFSRLDDESRVAAMAAEIAVVFRIIDALRLTAKTRT